MRDLPIHGQRFREAVSRVWKGHLEAGERFGKNSCTFQHPLGERDSTIFRLGGKYEGLSFVAFRANDRTQIGSLNIPSDGDWDSCFLTARFAAWSGRKFCVFMRFNGGSGNSDCARLFELHRGKLKLVRSLAAFGENALDGERNRIHVVASNPVNVQYAMEVRVPPPDQENLICHSSVWFDYREAWTLSDGVLRTSRPRLIETPSVAVNHLFHLMENHHRHEFNRLVLPGLRQTLWDRFLNLPHTAFDTFGDCGPEDESRQLLVGDALPVYLEKVKGHWTITKIGESVAPRLAGRHVFSSSF